MTTTATCELSSQHLTLATLGGDCMGWWFAVAGELYERGVTIPPEWQYRPSPLGAVDPDAAESGIVAEYDSGTLLKFGRMLTRYAAKLKQAGKAY